MLKEDVLAKKKYHPMENHVRRGIAVVSTNRNRKLDFVRSCTTPAYCCLISC